MKNIFILYIFTLLLISENASSQTPVLEIVKMVQQNNSNNIEHLSSLGFSGTVKSTTFIKHDFLNIEEVALIEEYVFDGIWIKPDSIRILVKAFRKYEGKLFVEEEDSTQNNMSVLAIDEISKRLPLPNPLKAIYNETSITRNIEKRAEKLKIKNPWPIFPFSKNSEQFYTYKLLGKVSTNNILIANIEVTPKRANIPSVKGTFQIDLLQNNVIGGEYSFNDAAKIKKVNQEALKQKNPFLGNLIPINEKYNAVFKNAFINSVFWFPIEELENLVFNFWGFDALQKREIKYTNYILNPGEDYLNNFENKSVNFKRDSLLENSLYEESGNLESLPQDEYDNIRNELEQSIKSSNLEKTNFDMDSFVSKVMNEYGNQIYEKNKIKLSELRYLDVFSFNRVEGLGFNQGISIINPIMSNSILSANSSYGISDKKLKTELYYLKYLNKSKSISIYGNIFDKLENFDNTSRYSKLNNSLSAIFFNTDYRDYYYKKGWSAGVGMKLFNTVSLNLSANFQKESTAIKNTDFSIFRYKNKYQFNPIISQGEYKTLDINLLYLRGQFKFNLYSSISDNDIFNIDHEFKTFNTITTYENQINTKLGFRTAVETGNTGGQIPLQRLFYSNGKKLLSNDLTFRALNNKYFSASKYNSSIFEFSYKPWYDTKISINSSEKDAGKKVVKFIVWAGFGKYDLDSNNIIDFKKSHLFGNKLKNEYYELGLGIGDIYNIVRFDMIVTNQNDISFKINLNFLR